ncbi:hypothetical protein SLE2022_089250 [Rubroshorea leprosula]
MFTEECWPRPNLKNIHFQQVSSEDNVMLTTAFSEEEIKQAVWDYSSTKAPRPNEFNFGCLKAVWETIKDDVIQFVVEFQKNGRLVKGLNASFIVLIPKKENIVRIGDYRPISLISCMYKVIPKLLANKLRCVLDRLIGKQQSAFIGRRQLMDSVMVANETIDEVKKKRKRCIIFKVDFEKAYDKVCWDFLMSMMEKMGFCVTWRNWILECLRTNLVLVLVNGSPTREFSMSRGLRQGDSLSLFLFLIVVEGLSGIIQSTLDKKQFSGV